MAGCGESLFVLLELDSEIGTGCSLLHDGDMLSNAGAKARLEGLEGDVISAIWANIPFVSFPERMNKWGSKPFVLRQLPNKLQHTSRQPTLIPVPFWEPWITSLVKEYVAQSV